MLNLAPCRMSNYKTHRRQSVVTRASNKPLVKICGVTNPEDALLASTFGANFIGMIMWPKAKRAVKPETAKEIVRNAHKNGAKAVGVFVSEDAETMAGLAREVGLDYIQLHGDKSRASLPNIGKDLKVIYVTSFDGEGACKTEIPDLELVAKARGSEKAVDFFLADGLQGGSGISFDWNRFQVPAATRDFPWILAGGLNPTNVAEASRLVRPHAVDVSSGVCGPDGLKKDPIKVSAFIEQVRLMSLGN